MKAVHQFVPTFEPGAIASDAIEVQKALRESGYESEIFAEYVREPFGEMAHVHTEYSKGVTAHDDDVLMYHMAIGSNVADWLRDRKQRLVLRHHNITPVEYYAPWPGSNTYGMAWGRNQLAQLASRVTLGTGVSEYNRRELEALHYPRTAVTPILFDFDAFDHATDETFLAKLGERKQNGGSDWLFVGWIAPHKCQHDIIRAFAMYRHLYDRSARLHLVGRTGIESYLDACRKLVTELGLGEAITFHGRVSDGELGAFYRIADVLVSMSEHEGVGIPLLEAMHHRVPVVAFAAAAVPETVGQAGLVLTRKKPSTVAAAVHRVISDDVVRNTIVERGTQRLGLFDLHHARKRLLEVLAPLG